MAYETQMNSNGRTESPPRAVARSFADFWHDLMVLFELQGKLIAVEVQEGARLARWSVVGMIGGVCLALSCLPVGFFGLAWLLAEQSALSPAQSLLVVFFVGLIVAGGVIYGCLRMLKDRVGLFPRSKAEWAENMRWAKATLKRIGPRPEAGVR